MRSATVAAMLTALQVLLSASGSVLTQHSVSVRRHSGACWSGSIPVCHVNTACAGSGTTRCRGSAGSPSGVGCDAEAAYPCKHTIRGAAPSAVPAPDHGLATSRRHCCCVAGLPWHTGSQRRCMPPADSPDYLICSTVWYRKKTGLNYRSVDGTCSEMVV